jgi:hypothetical protein
MTQLDQTAPDTKPAPKPLSPRTLLVLGIGLVLIGLVVTFLGFTEVRRTLQLNDVSTHINAKVVDSDVHSRNGDVSHVLRYRFKVDGKTYTYTDATGRRNLWASVARREWDAAKDAGEVDVLYDEGDPWVNRPASSDKAPIADSFAGLAFGIGLLVGGIVLLRKSRRTTPDDDLDPQP